MKFDPSGFGDARCVFTFAHHKASELRLGHAYGTLVLTERRPGYIITLIGGIIATGMPVIHLRGTGIVNVVKSSGGFFFLWTLFALGVLGMFSVILSVRGLWNPQWAQSR